MNTARRRRRALRLAANVRRDRSARAGAAETRCARSSPSARRARHRESLRASWLRASRVALDPSDRRPLARGVGRCRAFNGGDAEKRDRARHRDARTRRAQREGFRARGSLARRACCRGHRVDRRKERHARGPSSAHSAESAASARRRASNSTTSSTAFTRWTRRSLAGEPLRAHSHRRRAQERPGVAQLARATRAAANVAGALREPRVLRELPVQGASERGRLSARRSTTCTLDEAICTLHAPGAALFVVLDHVTDPHNVGAIIRTAEARRRARRRDSARPSRRRHQRHRPKVGCGGDGPPADRPGRQISQALRTLKKAGIWIAGAALGPDVDALHQGRFRPRPRARSSVPRARASRRSSPASATIWSRSPCSAKPVAQRLGGRSRVAVRGGAPAGRGLLAAR